MIGAFQAQSSRTVASELRRVDPLSIPDWDDLLLTHKSATVFHTRAWAQVLAETYHFTPEYFIAADGPCLHALLPLFEVRSWVTGVRGVSLPFTDCCDALESPGVTRGMMFRAAQELGRDRQWKYLELRGGAENVVQPSSEFYSHRLELTRSEEQLFRHCDPAMRRAIRKAEKENLDIQVSCSIAAVETYYQLHLLTRQKHGIPPQPFKFFRNIHRFLIGSGFGSVLLAFRNRKPVAGAIFLHFGNSSIYKYGASDPDHQEVRPNNLLLWRGILHMKKLGMETLSFGRTSLNQEGLRRFKLGFGPIESTLRYVRFCFRTNSSSVCDTDHSTGLHARLFRFCPRPISRLAGAAIYPHIA
jgi:hypothetical protein